MQEPDILQRPLTGGNECFCFPLYYLMIFFVIVASVEEILIPEDALVVWL